MTDLRDLTTMRVGGPAAEFVRADRTEDVLAAVRDADARGRPLLVMGGGSNLVVGDEGFDGVVVQVATEGLRVDGEHLTVDAGVAWDPLVETSLAEGLAGLEPLSGIPGTAGGTPVQNVGAYGALTSDLLESLTVYDRGTGAVEHWGAERCAFSSHRASVFKRSHRWVVLDLTYALRRSEESGPVLYADLARSLGVEMRAPAPAVEVRAAVLALRRQRGMVLDAADHDTWSVGSFFVNPVLDAVPARAEAAPRYPDAAGIKVPAGWLIEHAGFPRGWGHEFGRGAVALSSRHALAVTNRGDATTAEVMAFAAHVRDGVEREFDIRLRPECDLVNCALDETAPVT